MKKIVLTLILVLTYVLSQGQSSYKIEKLDSIGKTKTQLYSDTKMFISETWKSAQNVIQNDDKDGGMILIKGMTKQMVKIGMSVNEFYYSYTVKFLIKDGKYKIIIENVNYSSGPSPAWDRYADGLNVQDIYQGVWKVGIYEKQWITLMSSIKAEMQSIIDNYDKYIKTPSTNSGW